MILSLPFLLHNNITISLARRPAIHELLGFSLLHPVAPLLLPPSKQTLKENLLETHRNFSLLHSELKAHCTLIHDTVEAHCNPMKPFDIVAAVCERIECLALADSY